MRTRRLSLAPLFLLVAGAWALSGCDAISKLSGKGEATAESDDEDTPKKKKKSKKSDEAEEAPSASAAATAEAPVAPPSDAAAGGPMVTIPAGSFKAGSACAGVPRVTDEELVHAQVALGEFQIDVHPYPNDPTQAAKTNVSREEAEGLCKERGKRLCSELEWERACKGPEQTAFPYGAAYSTSACAASAALVPGQRAKCQSNFGMKDPFGLAYEWTSSSWGRGKGAGLATVRGYTGQSNVVRERCASGAGRDPATRNADIGFRCCSGPQNGAEVDLSPVRRPVLEKDASVSGSFSADLLRAMQPDHRSIEGVDLAFDQVWRWHPRDNEELVVARWVGRPKKGKPFYELAVFKLCGNAPTRVAHMRGPVGEIEPPATTSSSEKITAKLRTEGDRGELEITYWYGSVKFKEPPFVKAGNKLEAAEETVDPAASASATGRPRIPRIPRVPPKR